MNMPTAKKMLAKPRARWSLIFLRWISHDCNTTSANHNPLHVAWISSTSGSGLTFLRFKDRFSPNPRYVIAAIASRAMKKNFELLRILWADAQHSFQLPDPNASFVPGRVTAFKPVYAAYSACVLESDGFGSPAKLSKVVRLSVDV